MTITPSPWSSCFVEAAVLSRLVSGKGTPVTVANTPIALFGIDGTVLAIEDACVQCAQPLSDGMVAGRILRCAHCGWAYDLGTATLLHLPEVRLNTFPTKVDQARILIEWTLPP